MFKRCLFCVVGAYAAAFSALALLALFALRSPDPRAGVGVMGAGAYFIGAVVAALCGALAVPERSITAATLCGAGYTLPIAVLSLFFRDATTRPFWQSAIFYASGMALGAVIALLLSSRRGSSRATRKSMMKKINRRV